MDQHVVNQADFNRDGFLSIRALFDNDKINEINYELTRFIKHIVPQMPKEQVYYENVNAKHSLKQVQQLFKYDCYFRQLISDGIIREIAETVLEERVRPVNLQYFNKPPGTGQATPAHQDGYYFHLNPCKAVTGWLALESVDEFNGCVHYVRGSHKAEGFRPHGRTGVLGFSQGISDFGTEQDKANSIACCSEAGTFLLHDAKTIHFAGANTTTTRSRRALGFIYYAMSAREDLEARKRYQASLDRSLSNAGKI